MNPETITLYYREGRSDKVYTATLHPCPGSTGWEVAFGYGRRGSTMTYGKKVHGVGYAAAKRVYDKLVAEKRAKGYRGEAEPRGQPISGGDVVAMTSMPSFQIHDSGIRLQLLNECSEADVQRLIADDGWGMQIKMDGRRQALRKKGQTVTAINRRGLIIAISGPIITAAQQIPGSGTIDGEAMGDFFAAFDMLEDGESIRHLPYIQRYQRLALVLRNQKDFAIKLVALALTRDDKQAMFNMAKHSGGEGVVFKRLAAPSGEGRPASGGDALKFKFYATASCIVHAINARRSVQLMVYNEHGIGVNIGSVAIQPNRAVPQLGDVVEVRYLYAYPGGSLYQPTYLGVRDDITTDECTLEQLKFKQPTEEDE